MIQYSDPIDGTRTKPVRSRITGSWYEAETTGGRGVLHQGTAEQLFITCDACEGEGCISQQPQTAPPNAEMVNAIAPIQCIVCNGAGQTHIDLPIEQLKRVNEFMMVKDFYCSDGVGCARDKCTIQCDECKVIHSKAKTEIESILKEI